MPIQKNTKARIMTGRPQRHSRMTVPPTRPIAAYRRLPVALAVLAALPLARAHADEDTSAVLEEVVVTAQKRTESMQDVPVSIQALGSAKLDQLHVTDFQDYVRMLPSVSTQGGGQGFGPGFNRVYMRGVASGDNGNHSGPRPSVGMYLDEQPVTTIQGALDIHIYDIERVESLAGPQGTLYGASSEAGTIRIITNKPDPSGFKAGYDLEGSTTEHGSQGYAAEGFVNLPLADNVALRVVGWDDYKPGYIDNRPGTLTYPTTGVTINNADYVQKHYNDVATAGGRSALRIELDDSWTLTPGFMMQDTRTHGSFGFDPSVGDLAVEHYHPEGTIDRWYQASLTVEGKISNFDVVYAGAYLHRHDETHQDYVDYSFFYDTCCAYWSNTTIFGPGGTTIDPSQYISAKDGYRSESHELRVSSPKEWRLRFLAGVFFQRQRHDIEQVYTIVGLDPSLAVTGWPDTWWLTEQQRVDRDRAFFTEANYDITDKLTLTGGIRFFDAMNSLVGFYGFGATNGFSSTGEKGCFKPAIVANTPCTNLDTVVKESGSTPKLNLSYKLTPEQLYYATFSKGFRPGGTNRRSIALGVPLPPYKADYLTNYEVGWKTSWFGNSLRFNGAFFQEDWKDFQFSYLGANALTEIRNAGAARIRGAESQLEWAVTHAFTLSASAALTDAKLTQDFCKNLDSNGQPLSRSLCPADSFAPAGTQLPVTPKFKTDVTARYGFAVGDAESFVQANVSYQGSAPSSLFPSERVYLYDQRSYAIADLSAGFTKDRWTVTLFLNNALDKRADEYNFVQCPVFQPGTGGSAPLSATLLCGQKVYEQTNMPRTIGIKFGEKF